MQQKQEKPLSPKEKKVKRAKEAIEKEKKTGTVRLPGGAGGRSKKFHELGNFKKAKARLEETGKLSLDDFDNAQEIGMFLDWYNKEVSRKKQDYNDNEIVEISKLLARIHGRKSIIIGK